MKTKQTLQQIEQELAEWKALDAAHHARKLEMMYLLYVSGKSMVEIAKIFGGCTRQYIQQQVKRYEANAA